MSEFAIIGLSCLFPGADGPDEFWRTVEAGRRTTADATAAELGADPSFFYDANRIKPDTSYFLHGGYIHDFVFDPHDYALPQQAIANLDRMYQWALRTARSALQDSGYLGNERILAQTGVIIGNLNFPTRQSSRLFQPIYDEALSAAINDVLNIENLTLSPLGGDSEPQLEDALSSGYPAAVIASALGLGGTHFALDAACGSSLYAVGLACKYLATGQTDLMLAGAVSAADPLFVNMGFAHLGGYPSPDSDSRPLDATSGGLISGEGAGMFVLKRYADAIRDGDHIYAVVRGVGLSNDGRGKHILTPNSKGQTLALQRAYEDAELSPDVIDYVECHASGTPLGDKTELNSMEMFFGTHKPLIGSVKSNVGHLLTAAGMASMTRLILSMAHGVIPKTIGLKQPLESQGGAFGSTQMVVENTQWRPHNGAPKRAGVNAFGFGGVSAHIILEANERQAVTQISNGTTNNRVRMAITGMDAHFGALDTLDDFARAIYDGDTAFIPLPEDRWKGLQHHPELLQRFGLDYVPDGAYIGAFELDFMQFKIPPNRDDEPIPQQLMLLKVADRAIRDAGLDEGGNVAVLIALGTELALHRYRGRADLNWQVQQALQSARVQLTAEQTIELERIAKDSLLSPAQVNHYTSYIGNIAASRVSQLWDFNGPAFTISAEENSAFKALEVAQLLLADGTVDAVVVGAVDLSGNIENTLLRHARSPLHKGEPVAGFDASSNGWMIGEGAGAVVLKRADDVAPDQAYAVIESVALAQDASQNGQLPGAPSAQTVAQAAQNALNMAGVGIGDIGYVELHASGSADEDQAEIEGTTAIYRGDAGQTAIGTVKANIGHTFAASGIASLIKTTLALAQRFIPAVPNWTGPESPERWQGTLFYVAPRSTAWLDDKRIAAISGLGGDGVAAHVILSGGDAPAKDTGDLHQGAPYLLPIAANDVSGIVQKFDELSGLLATQPLRQLAADVYADYAKNSGAAYTACIIGRDADEIAREIERARDGIATAVNAKGEWSTPAGSYFTANPVGQKGSVDFVYPGAFNSYPKLGYDIFRLFPDVYDALKQVKSNVGEAVAEEFLYPHVLEKPGPKLTRQMKEALNDAPVAMMESGLSFALIYSRIMRDYFNVQPASAFGYSLGEGSMLWGMGVWKDGNTGSRQLRQSTLFQNRLTGPMDAIREAWAIPAGENDFWAAHFISAPVDAVRSAVANESKVYLTHINTPNECMIAGDPQACQRVVEVVGGESMKAPFSVVIHNEAMMSEFGEFYRLHHLPATPVEGVTFYSAADYAPMSLDQNVLANHIARMSCKQIDFPRLIERAYADGARVFIELGPRSTCARWIDETLGAREHVAVSIDNMGVDARTSIIRMLAQLVSHQVSLDISQLYAPVEAERDMRRSFIRTVRLGGDDIYSAIANEENRAKFADAVQTQPARVSVTASTSIATPAFASMTALPERFSEVHADFLRTRREGLRQIGELIEMQMADAGQNQPTSVAAETIAPAPPTDAPKRLKLPPAPNPAPAPSVAQGIAPLYDYDKVNTFALGRVADCYGERYAIYDNRRAPRIPNSELLLVTRAVDIIGERFQSKAGTSIHAEYDVPVDAWFYKDNAYPMMPYSVYMEIALQPSGFLSAYHGPTLEFPDIDFYFRNLDGNGTLYHDLDMRGRTITNHVTLTSSVVMLGTIIQSFKFQMYDGELLFYEGAATFGYHTKEVLSSQAGLDLGKQIPRWIDTVELAPSQIIAIDPHQEYGEGYLKLAHGYLEFTDEIKVVPNGGTFGAGYAYANTIIDPNAWFFRCHFHQDPVMPGSIGLETVMQALQAYAIATGLGEDFETPRFAQADGEHKTVWKYRGQILSDSEKSHVEANIKRIEKSAGKTVIYADASLWRDALRIYEAKDIALAIVEA